MRARRLPLPLIALLLLLAPASQARTPEQKTLYTDAPNGMYLLDSGWATRADGASGYAPASVPHSFNVRPLTERGFRSRVQWYRLRFTLPDDPSATSWRLRFESVNNKATVWLNGTKLGGHRGAHLPFELPATSARAGENELLVRVDGRLGKSDLPPSNRVHGWWNYGGLLREVYLRSVHDFDLADLRVAAGAGTPSRVDVSAMVRNTTGSAAPLDYVVDVSGAGGFKLSRPVSQDPVGAGRLAKLQTSFEIPLPALWAPGKPNLYDLRVTLPGGQVVRTHFAVRHWAVTPDGHVTLNGRAVSLRGASFHESTPARGWALRPDDRRGIVDDLKALGADFTRQHYPPHPALLEAFDREGIVFWEQIPMWRLRDENIRGALRARALSMLRRTVLRDRNHASVMTWSVSNETLKSGRNDRSYLRAAKALVRRLDPTRLVGADKSLRPLTDLPSFYSTLDVLGLNEYLGWYGGSAAELPADLAELRGRFPSVGLFATEFGAESNRSGPASKKGTFEFQARYLADHLGIFDAGDAVNGALVWALRDFACRPGWKGGSPTPRPPFNEKGIYTRSGGRKLAFDVVRSHFEAVPALRQP
jgi:beta-glucuronidase